MPPLRADAHRPLRQGLNKGRTSTFVGAWKVQYTDGHFHTPFSVSCPSPALCIAADDNGNAFTSVDPTGGGSAWSVSTHKVDPRYGINNISCTATALCVTGDNGGYVVAGQLPLPNTKITKSSIDKSKHTATFTFQAVGFATGLLKALLQPDHPSAGIRP